MSEPASAFTVKIDSDDPSWAYFTVNDPNAGPGYGFADLVNGSWEVYAVGSSEVGCPPGSEVVPPQVMAYFGIICPPSSGNSGTTGNT